MIFQPLVGKEGITSITLELEFSFNYQADFQMLGDHMSF